MLLRLKHVIFLIFTRLILFNWGGLPAQVKIIFINYKLFQNRIYDICQDYQALMDGLRQREAFRDSIIEYSIHNK
jgi:hypothetical protein